MKTKKYVLIYLHLKYTFKRVKCVFWTHSSLPKASREVWSTGPQQHLGQKISTPAECKTEKRKWNDSSGRFVYHACSHLVTFVTWWLSCAGPIHRHLRCLCIEYPTLNRNHLPSASWAKGKHDLSCVNEAELFHSVPLFHSTSVYWQCSSWKANKQKKAKKLILTQWIPWWIWAEIKIIKKKEKAYFVNSNIVIDRIVGCTHVMGEISIHDEDKITRGVLHAVDISGAFIILRGERKQLSVNACNTRLCFFYFIIILKPDMNSPRPNFDARGRRTLLGEIEYYVNIRIKFVICKTINTTLHK